MQTTKKKKMLTFIETPVFSKSWAAIANDDELSKLQDELMAMPEVGDVIQGTGGVRKLRFGSGSKGKQGGSRVIYYNKLRDGKIYLLLAYPKSVKDDLTSDQKKKLADLVKEL
ncbi:hypothetical protein [Aliivibrio fischeri]|uniref:hypothetical protein n=1 Tax=Aliivibrio fischeri TaxID=668 RepID=UPI000A85DFDB